MTVGVRLILVLVVLTFLLSACGPQATPVPETKEPEEAPAAPAVECPETIKIGTVTDQTGPLAAFGAQSKWGYEKAAEIINADGGIFVEECGKKVPVEILYGDHSADEQKAVTEMEYLVEQGVIALSGTTAIMPLGQVVAEKSGVPIVIANGSLVDPFQQGFRYLFGIGWMNTDCAKWPFMLLEDLGEPKATKIGFMEEQNLMGIDYSIWFQREAVERGFTDYIIQKYQRFGGDFSTQILALKEADVDFVYAPMIGPDGIPFWMQMKELDYNPKAVLMLSAPAVRADWLSMGPDADYVITTNAYHWATEYEGAAEFAEWYRDESDGENPPELAGNCYAAVQVIADAIERAGSLDHDKVRDALTETNLDTIQGNIQFHPNGMAIKEYFLVQYIDGVETIVWPADMAEREPVYPFPAWTSR
jgi:branched-chain amino acid transport system substrate-binding protein